MKQGLHITAAASCEHFRIPWNRRMSCPAGYKLLEYSVPYSGDFGKQRRTRSAGEYLCVYLWFIVWCRRYLRLFAGELLVYTFEGTTQNKHKIWKGVNENALNYTPCYFFNRSNICLKSLIVWDMTPFIPLQGNQRFGGICRLHVQVRIS
jgi:hypothetical protein